MTDTPETPAAGAESHAEGQTGAAPTDPITETAQDEPETFPREYVSALRDEAKSWRLKAAKTDELSARLHAELTKADGRLADWQDLPFDPEHLTDQQKHADAITALIQAKPHYASRVPVPGTTIGQGQQGSPVAPKPGLIDAIRAKQGR